MAYASKLKMLRRTLAWPAAVVLVAGVTLFAFRFRDMGRSDLPASPQSQVYDFGERKPGDTLRHTFVLANGSSKPLAIKSVVSSCACTVPGKKPVAIPARSSVDIPVSAVIPANSERFGSSVAVTFESGTRIILSLAAHVVMTVPTRIEFGKVRRGEAVQRQIPVRSPASHTIEVKQVLADERYFTASSAVARQNARDSVITIALKPDIPFGPFTTDLRVVTDDPAQPVKTIPVAGYVLQPVEVEPTQLVFGLIDPGQTKRASLKIWSPYGASVAIKSVDPAAGTPVACDLSEMKPIPGGFELPFSVRGVFDSRLLKGSVRIRAEINGMEKEFEVECYAMSRSQGQPPRHAAGEPAPIRATGE